MGQFSDDGLWWWNGTTWIATTQIVLPQLPVTEFLYPALWISCGNRQWRIPGTPSVFSPEPVLEAWRQAATSMDSNQPEYPGTAGP